MQQSLFFVFNISLQWCLHSSIYLVEVFGHSGCYAKRNIALIARDELTGGEKNGGVSVRIKQGDTTKEKTTLFTLNY